MDYCTCSPDRIFNIYIGDICKKHDIAYANSGNYFKKCWADILLGWRISTRNWKLTLIGPIYTLFTLLFGGIAWRKHKK